MISRGEKHCEGEDSRDQKDEIAAEIGEDAGELDAEMVDQRLAGGDHDHEDELADIGLLDTEGAAYLDSGLKYLKVTGAELLERIAREPKLLRLPLVRCGNRLSAGRDEEAWKAMLATD